MCSSIPCASVSSSLATTTDAVAVATKFAISCVRSSNEFVIWIVEVAVYSESDLNSLATTRKPCPLSPARAASTAAFNDNRDARWAIVSISSEIFCTNDSFSWTEVNRVPISRTSAANEFALLRILVSVSALSREDDAARLATSLLASLFSMVRRLCPAISAICAEIRSSVSAWVAKVALVSSALPDAPASFTLMVPIFWAMSCNVCILFDFKLKLKNFITCPVLAHQNRERRNAQILQSIDAKSLKFNQK